MTIESRPLLLYIFMIVVLCPVSLQGQHHHYPVIAHAHNDYEQKIPLFTALDNGFSSIEIDVFEYRDKIVVCHDEEDVPYAPTIEETYLNPLFLSGAVRSPLILLIDLKEDDTQLLKVLEASFSPYQSYLQLPSLSQMPQ